MNLKFLLIFVCFVLFAEGVQGVKRFVAYRRRANAYQAMQICGLKGGHLASVESLDEHNQVLDAIRKTGYQLTKGRFWLLGGSDLGIEEDWIWLGVDKKMVYKNFNDGEPNNDGEQDCLMIDGIAPGYKWNDIECNLVCFGFVCAYNE